MNSAYRFVLEIKTLNGEVVHSHALEPDWEPALEGARLAGLRQLGVWPDGDAAESSVDPVWHETAGQPVAQKLRVQMKAAGRSWCTDLTTTEYFADEVRTIVAAQLAAKRLESDERVRYGIAAYPMDTPTTVQERQRLSAVDRSRPLAIRDRAFSALAARSVARGDSEASDFDVVMPEPVIDEIHALAKAAGEYETGGILIGHLCRDERRADVGLEITAQIPARHTIGRTEKLTFTSETWTDVRSAVALRKSGELLCGWWHSHPAFSWCAKCPAEKQRVCPYATGFLSADDKALHRSIFPTAFTQALVVANSIAGLDTRLFGWRNGVLSPRGFRLIPHAGTAPTTHQPRKDDRALTRA